MSRRSALLPLLLVAVSLLGGCAGDGAGSAAPSSTSSKSPTTSDSAAQHDCSPPSDTTPVAVTAVGSAGRDFNVTSFDGTEIRAHWFPHPEAAVGAERPTVLMGPGWSLPGATTLEEPEMLGSIDIQSLRDAGYNVLTWDPRGFGASGGTAMIDSADYEGRDVQQLIDWVATLPGVDLDSPRDPRLGMVGGSYGGGIQLVTAALDCRVDAIVPIIAWHSLQTSLYKNGTVKAGWARVLSEAALMSNIDPHIRSAADTALTTGTLSAEDMEWFVARGPGQLVKQIKVPTLLIHGTNDTLFTLAEAVTNYRLIASNDVPVAMLWNCDGHGVCLDDPGDPRRAARAAIAWLDRYVAHKPGVELGPAFDIIDQHGKRYVADAYKAGSAEVLTAEGRGSLSLSADGGAGPLDPNTVPGQILAFFAAAITPTRATNAVETTLTATHNALVVGEPVIEVTYRGEAGPDDGSGRPTRVFAQLVDEQTGTVIGNQITPVQLTLDGREHRVELPLEIIAHSLRKGERVTLQLVPTTVAYAQPRLGGSVDFTRIELSLPVADWLDPAN